MDEFYIDEKLADEANQIAMRMGLTLDEVINIMLRRFVDAGGFLLPAGGKDR